MRILLTLGLVLVFAGCSQLVPEPYETSQGHIVAEPAPGTGQQDIPALVEQAAPALPEPTTAEPQEKYTVVVNEVPVKEILFALARDAKVNVDVDPRIDGVVTLNAVDQTLTQLLDRISRQVPIRYELDGDTLFIAPDEPHFRTYKVNYISMSREMDGQIKLQTSVGGTAGGGAGGGGGGGGAAGGGAAGTGSTNVNVESQNQFWDNLVTAVSALVDPGEGGTAATSEKSVVPYPETGLLAVRATAAQHALVQQLVDAAVESGQRQVMIQATIAEVSLNTKFQAGIDWSILPQIGDASFSIASSLLPAAGLLQAFSGLVLDYEDNPDTTDNIINAQVRLLEEFGDVSILSSPQIMTLNNQTAILRVVDDIVYFEVDATTTQSQTQTNTTVDTEARTVAVGVTMSVTPQINANDSILLNVRPSISRVLRFVQDPNPSLRLSSGVPELRVREMESVLRVNNGQIAVLGGLMENNDQSDDAQTPGISRIEGIGELFKSRTRQSRKTELVIFLRPIVVRNPSLEADLQPYRRFLRQP